MNVDAYLTDEEGNVIQILPSHISVVLCAYTEERWDDLVAAIKSVQQQTLPPLEIIVVIDHNQLLLKRLRQFLPDVIVIENQQAKGASGARNCGMLTAQGALVAFLDDDARADPTWIEHLVACYADPNVVGVGGGIEPLWLGKRPFWFPDEFNWVVGCSYRGMPLENTPVRNLIGANMSVRRQIALATGGFRVSFGNNKDKHVMDTSHKWLQHHAGDEETELCIRISQRLPDLIWLYAPSVSVKHCVPAQRGRWAYFLWRCYDEGLGKALLVRLHGLQTGLSSERHYTYKVLPEGIMRGLADALFYRNLSGLGRAIAIVIGLMMTIVGYLLGSVFTKPALSSGDTDNIGIIHVEQVQKD